MPEGEIFDVIERFRRALLQNERRAASEIVRVYGEAWKRIEAELERLDAEYQAAKARGEKPDADWIFRFNRARAFHGQVEQELLAFAQHVEGKVRQEQIEAIEVAEKQAEELTRRILGRLPPGLTIDWNRIDRAAVETLLGMTQADSPLHRLLLSISQEGAQAAEDALVQGMLLGQNPREVGRQMRRTLGTTLSRALTIARTETLRAHREATRASYQANSDIVKGWVWHSAADERTCAACWAMHGTEHRLDEILDDHPNGRCAMVPKARTWAEIGERYGLDLSDIPDTQPQIEPGTSLFEKLSDEQQIKILGPAKWAAWRERKQRGTLSLSDFVGQKWSNEWGTYRYERSLQSFGLNGSEYLKKYREIMSRKALPVFQSHRTDIAYEFYIGEHLSNVFRNLSGIRNVIVTNATVGHYRKHKGEFDVEKAESLLEKLIRDPLIIYPDKKKNSVLFVDEFDDRFYLLVPIKMLPGEMWLQTLYVEEKKRFMKRWGKREPLYRRK